MQQRNRAPRRGGRVSTPPGGRSASYAPSAKRCGKTAHPSKKSVYEYGQQPARAPEHGMEGQEGSGGRGRVGGNGPKGRNGPKVYTVAAMRGLTRQGCEPMGSHEKPELFRCAWQRVTNPGRLPCSGPCYKPQIGRLPRNLLGRVGAAHMWMWRILAGAESPGAWIGSHPSDCEFLKGFGRSDSMAAGEGPSPVPRQSGPWQGVVPGARS
jgi:hypothetical protein